MAACGEYLQVQFLSLFWISLCVQERFGTTAGTFSVGVKLCVCLLFLLMLPFLLKKENANVISVCTSLQIIYLGFSQFNF